LSWFLLFNPDLSLVYSGIHPAGVPPGRLGYVCKELLQESSGQITQVGRHRRRSVLALVHRIHTSYLRPHSHSPGVVQNTQQGFQFNGESDLDLQYAMSLVTAKQEVTLYQVGDEVQGAIVASLLSAVRIANFTFLDRRLIQQLPRRFGWFLLHIRGWRRPF
jgi:hypothetical protein